MNLNGIGKLREWKKDPLLFVREAFDWDRVVGFDGPSSQQADALSQMGTAKRTSIRSGHGTGKDAMASWLIYWWMSTRPFAKVAATAPTGRQLSDILWSELAKWHRYLHFADEFVIQKDKLFHKDAPKEWWARAISPSVKASKEEQAETLAGLHGDHLFIIVDEASGVNDPVFVPLEGALTQEDNRVLLIGNPTKNKGYFHETHFDPKTKKRWLRFHWDSRLSTNVVPDMVDYFRDKYGEDSNVFRIRVAGNPPVDAENTLIPLDWAISCIGNEQVVDEDEPIYISADIARYGEDASIVLPRQGYRIDPWRTFRKMNTMELAGHIMQTFLDTDAEGIGLDGIGVGGGVADNLYKKKGGTRFTHEVNVSTSSTDPAKYHRLRDELWWKLRENCQNRRYWFPDTTVKFGGLNLNLGQELANELSIPTYDPDHGGRGVLKVESKPEMKRRGEASPNIADALGISEYFYGSAFDLWAKAKDKRSKRTRKHPLPGIVMSNSNGTNNWMYV